jgi:hypothetical protein
MNKVVAGLFALGLAGVCMLMAQPPRDRDPDRKGPPRGGPPRFELGRVLPPFVHEELELTDEQEKRIADLEKEVKEKLTKILTREQQEKIKTLRPRGPGGPGGPGDRPPRGPGDGDRVPRDGRPPREEPPPADPAKGEQAAGGIPWFATWEGGLKEATRSGKPILLVSAAPHCAGVSGTW